MHYYQFNIADYRKDTVHLTPIEHYIYRTLIDWYYLDETPIPAKTDVVLRKLRLCHDNEENLLNVLSDFFDARDGNWHHSRIEEEINNYKEQLEKASRAGKASALARSKQQTFNDRSTTVQPTNNHKPITNNQNTLVGEICIAIKNEGILDINPSNPTFLTLIDAGASVDEFSNAAKIAKERGKNFAYTIAIVKGQREDAKNIDIHKGSMPKKESFGWRNDDTLVLKKAAALGIYTSGKSRFEILAAIDRKEGKA